MYKLIKDYWYEEHELVIGKEKYWKGVLQYTKLTGTRSLKKEYSYIPLHFMRELCLPDMEKFITKNVVDDYDISHDELLISAKKYLTEYVYNNAPEWDFIDDEELNKRIKQNEAIKEAEKLKKQKELEEPLYDLPGNMDYDSQKLLSDYINSNKFSNENSIENSNIKSIVLDEITVYGGRQGVLRKLRHQYFHWSANRDWLGMDPNNRKREVH